MLYKKKTATSLADSLFQNPTSEDRSTPFWAWNCELDKETLQRQIEYLKEMGFGGFHMHSRTGMATEYLSEEFMDLVKACVDKAEQEEMLAWLYDEDRWPSGAAGGYVTREPKYRIRKLVFAPNRMECLPKEEAIRTGGAYLVACFDVSLNEAGELEGYTPMGENDTAAGNKWFAYCVTEQENPWYNNQTYADTLNGEAIEKFVSITHEAYKQTVGDRFGASIPAIFTDEPQFSSKSTLGFADDIAAVTLPWTNDLEETFESAYHKNLVPHLPELIWELPDGKISRVRYLYHDHIAERFASAFADTCGGWCEQNGIMLTGHMMAEETLQSQTKLLGDCMRSYRSFQLPGIDMLCNHMQLTTAKQAQSAAHQYGREGVLSELYGVTNWDFDFRGHTFQGDWQAALGVTVRVPHLSWVSMAGEAKRDYPASINYQSPWYKEYSYVEDHFARVNTAMTRGEPVVRIGVIHPVESYWLHWGPKQNTSAVRSQLETNFLNITNWLLYGQLDFDFICESLLPQLYQPGEQGFAIGEMCYDTVIVPGCETLRKTTLDALWQFQRAGGNLLFLGDCPSFIDAVPSAEPKTLYQAAKQVAFEKNAVLTALQRDRTIEIKNADGTMAENLFYQLRQDTDCRWLFIAQGINKGVVDIPQGQEVQITLYGEYSPLLYNTLDGSIRPAEYQIKNGLTTIKATLFEHDSLLFKLCADGAKAPAAQDKTVFGQKKKEIIFGDLLPYKCSEPNVLLLDMAEYAFDDGAFQPEEEILRADNLFRDALGWPARGNSVAQPWVIEPETITHHITLRFTIDSEITVSSPVLAIEDAESVKITLNGEPTPSRVTGYYVDESIKTVALPALQVGKNTLTVTIPFGKRTSTEWCYLLGDFGVRVQGRKKIIQKPFDKIGFGSITDQGMPFYGGNITYQAEFETDDGNVTIHAPQYRGSLIGVELDGKRAGVIAYSPYTINLRDVPAGKHSICFTLFGNRYNSFAALHNADLKEAWAGPNLWKTQGDKWCYEYRLKEMGILSSPVIEIYE